MANNRWIKYEIGLSGGRSAFLDVPCDANSEDWAVIGRQLDLLLLAHQVTRLYPLKDKE